VVVNRQSVCHTGRLSRSGTHLACNREQKFVIRREVDGSSMMNRSEDATRPDGVVRLAALSDIHYGKNSQGSLQPLFAEIGRQADALIICGDLTDYGLPDEAHILGKDLTSSLRIPVVAVLGNHDFESGRQEEVCEILNSYDVTVLDGDSCEVHGIGIAGIKGFAGGFGRGALGFWGEPAIKAFVQESLNEALKLESALARLRTPQKIAVIHYAPIQGTVEG
jgi:Icc-related predicted phosphoesterase